MLVFKKYIKDLFDELMLVNKFKCSSANEQSVCYTNRSISICITYDQLRSYELDIIFVNNRTSEQFNLGQFLRFKEVADKENYKGFIVSDQNELINVSKRLFNLLKSYGYDFFNEEDSFFSKMAVFAKKESEESIKKRELVYIRQEAEQAWHAKNYKKVIELYKQIESLLKLSEKKRMEFAKKQI